MRALRAIALSTCCSKTRAASGPLCLYFGFGGADFRPQLPFPCVLRAAVALLTRIFILTLLQKSTSAVPRRDGYGRPIRVRWGLGG